MGIAQLIANIKFVKKDKRYKLNSYWIYYWKRIINFKYD